MQTAMDNINDTPTVLSPHPATWLEREPQRTHQPVIKVEQLAIEYASRTGPVRAVRDVSFTIQRGETLGLVGESGCGKSTVAFGMVNYLGRNGRIAHGSILFQGQPLEGRSDEELRRLRGDQIAMVYQNPMTALNPVLTIGQQMMEVLQVHQQIRAEEARTRCIAMLKRVYMPDPERMLERYPHQISGGQQQRVVIATAMLNNPALLIMDEPTTALDVTVEAAVLDLVDELRREYDTAILFISHNLGVIARICDNVAVMYAGEIVEHAPVRTLFANPRHPYTQGLLRAIPRIGDTRGQTTLVPIRGRVPPPRSLPAGCTFAPRCDYARDACQAHPVELRQIGPQHKARCVFAEEIDPAQWQPPAELLPSAPRAAPLDPNAEPLQTVEQMKTYYTQPDQSLRGLVGMGTPRYVRAVDGVSFALQRGHTLGIVGESGSGKSTLIKTLIRLESVTDGKAEFMHFDLQGKASQRDLNLIRELQMVFQNPTATLNPSYSVGRQIERPLRRFKVVPLHAVRAEVIRLLQAVKLDEHYYDRLQGQLSGGEQQRIGIARAFAGRPDLVLCDEPVSALDVSVQAAVLNLLSEIQRTANTTMIFIAHDLSVVRYIADEVGVMYLGQIVDIGPAAQIYQPPYHPYTESLLAAVPIPDPTLKRDVIRLTGDTPSLVNPPSGCRFHTRCPRRTLLPDGGAICVDQEPAWQQTAEGQLIRCHIPLEQLATFTPVLPNSANHAVQSPAPHSSEENRHARAGVHAATPDHD